MPYITITFCTSMLKLGGTFSKVLLLILFEKISGWRYFEDKTSYRSITIIFSFKSFQLDSLIDPWKNANQDLSFDIPYAYIG